MSSAKKITIEKRSHVSFSVGTWFYTISRTTQAISNSSAASLKDSLPTTSQFATTTKRERIERSL